MQGYVLVPVQHIRAMTEWPLPTDQDCIGITKIEQHARVATELGQPALVQYHCLFFVT